MPNATPETHTHGSATNQRTPLPASRRKMHAARASRKQPMNSGLNPRSAPLVATGAKPQSAAASNASSKPAHDHRG